MPDEAQKGGMLRKLELGALVTLALAVIGFAFWLGGLQAKIDKIDPDKIAASIEAKIADAITKSGTTPKGTIVAWYSKSGPVPAGWALCDGNDGRPNLTGKFLRGTVHFTDVGTSGGSETHSHTVFGHGNKQGEGVAYSDDRELGHTDDRSNLPPFTTVAYIIKL